MIWQALTKELRLLFRDIHGIAVLFVMPIAFILIMSLALSEADDVHKDAKIALIGSDHELNRALKQALIAHQLKVTLLPHAKLDQAQKDLIEKDYDLLIVNPNNEYTLDLSRDQPLALQVIASTDKTWMLGLKGWVQQSYTQLRLNNYFDALPKIALPEINLKAPKKIQQQQKEARIAAQNATPDSQAIDAYLATDQLKETYIDRHKSTVKQPNSVQQSVPAWLIFGMFFIMIPLSNVMAEEKITNTLVRLRLAKASPFMLLLSKFLPYFLINQIQLISMTLLGIYILPFFNIQGLELVGPWYNYYVIALAISFCALGYGLFISVIAKSTEHAVVLGGGGNIIMAAIGGIMVPSYVMPETMQTVAKLSPMSWGLQGFHDLLLNGYTLQQVMPTWSVLMAFSGVFLLLTYFIYRQQFKKIT